MCDNIDLETIILEYIDYHYAKYNRYPKLCKKTEVGNIGQNKRERVSKVLCSKQEDSRVTEECNNIGRSKIAQKHAASTWNELNLGITVTPIFPAESGDRVAIQMPISDETFIDNERVLKPIGNLYPLGSELKDIADVMSRVRNEKIRYIISSEIMFLSSHKIFNNSIEITKRKVSYRVIIPSIYTGKKTNKSESYDK